MFVHGIFSSSETWRATSQRLAGVLQITPYLADLPSTAVLESQAAVLDNAFAGLPASTIAIGHSQGGLISRQWSRTKALSGLLTLGTPHTGALAHRSRPGPHQLQLAGLQPCRAGHGHGLGAGLCLAGGRRPPGVPLQHPVGVVERRGDAHLLGGSRRLRARRSAARAGVGLPQRPQHLQQLCARGRGSGQTGRADLHRHRLLAGRRRGRSGPGPARAGVERHPDQPAGARLRGRVARHQLPANQLPRPRLRDAPAQPGGDDARHGSAVVRRGYRRPQLQHATRRHRRGRQPAVSRARAPSTSGSVDRRTPRRRARATA